MTFLALILVLYTIQPHFVFTPTYYRDENDIEYERLSIIAEDGVELEAACYTPKKFTSGKTILFFAGRSHDALGVLPKLIENYPSLRIITFNYRSYGKSKGSIDEKKLFSDSLRVATLVQKNYGDFYLMGFSLGSIAASYVASKHKVLALILVGTFDSFASLVEEKFKISLSWILRYKFNNIEFVKHIDTPTYIFASLDDETTYIKNVRNLKNSVKNLQRYREFSHLSHKELLWDKRVVQEINELE